MARYPQIGDTTIEGLLAQARADQLPPSRLTMHPETFRALQRIIERKAFDQHDLDRYERLGLYIPKSSSALFARHFPILAEPSPTHQIWLNPDTPPGVIEETPLDYVAVRRRLEPVMAALFEILRREAGYGHAYLPRLKREILDELDKIKEGEHQ